MKNKVLIISVCSMIAVAQFSMGQGLKNSFEVKAGLGLLQGCNIGLNYYYTDKHDVGIGFGSYFFVEPKTEIDEYYSVQLENTLHFGSKTIQHVGGWYFNQQLIYLELGDLGKALLFGLNIGKTICILPKLGINLEVGPSFGFDVHVYNNRPPIQLEWGGILPSMRVQLTYKFN